MKKEFCGQIAAITGAASGIGKEIALQFGREGAKVVAMDINDSGCEETVAEIIKEGGEAIALHLDLLDVNSVDQCFAEIDKCYGRLDILVNSGGILSFEEFDQMTVEQWDRIVNVDLRGTFLCCQNASHRMKEQREGVIINISAGAAKAGGVNVSSAYVAAKGGVHSLTIHYAKKLSPYGVRVNAVCPGATDTPMLEVQKHLPGKEGEGNPVEVLLARSPFGVGYPKDIAYGVLFLASKEKARFITGEIFDINGGGIMD